MATLRVQLAARAALRDGESSWDAFVQALSSVDSRDLSTLKCTTKIVGDAWEVFCIDFLRARHYRAAYLLKDTPPPVLTQLGLGHADKGIDLVVFDPENRPCAVQCKFRRRGGVSWRDLATFEALCARSGPWHRHIVMTNAWSVRREGTRQSKDLTFTRRAFAKLARHEWLSIAGYGEGNVIGSTGESAPSVSVARERFLQRLEASPQDRRLDGDEAVKGEGGG